MKKLLYISLVLSLFSCSSSDDTTEDTPSPIVHTEKAYVYNTDGVGTVPNPKEYYEFTYENGNLVNVKGRFLPVFFQMFNMFFSELTTQLSYNGNKIKVSVLEFAGISKHDEYLYYMENSRPQKAEYYYVNKDTGNSPIVYTKTYTYEQDRVEKTSIKFNNAANTEYATTYYYDDKNNLIKSEMLETGNGVTYQRTTTTYSDFDNAANPFKKLYLINDVFYEKSLSANNFRTKESVVERLNPNSSVPPKISKKTWTYKYDVNGQVLLYFPFP